MEPKTFNQNFRLSSYYGMEALAENEISDLLKNDYSIFRTFERLGIIHSRQFSFINKITFSPYDKNSMEGGKNREEIIKAKQKIQLIEDYFNNLNPRTIRPIKIEFVARKDNECALYDSNRFDNNSSVEKFNEIFGC